MTKIRSHIELLKSMEITISFLLNRFPELLKKLCISVVFLCCFISNSQSFLISYPDSPENATSCNVATVLKVKMNVIQASTTGAEVTIDLADGMEYEVGSVIKTAGTAAFTIIENGGTANQPKFTLGPANLAVGDFIEFTILRRALCQAYDNVLLGNVFIDEVIGDINGTLSNQATTPYTINYPSLSFVQPLAINDALIGDIHNRTFSITNGADGCANAIHFSIDYNGSGITQQALTLGGAVINPTSVVGTLHHYTVSGSLLTADGQLCNGESLTFTETIEINSCSPETNYSFGWGCSSDPMSWCTTILGTGTVNLATGFPIFKSNTNTKIGYVDMCTPFQVQTEFVNSGTGHAKAATMYNIELRKGRAHSSLALASLNSNYTISNATLNSLNVPWTFSGGIFTVSLSDYFTTDPDGAGVGLDDIDGDGFYDDLPKDSKLNIVMDVSMNCNRSCGANTVMDNFGGDLGYTTMCDNEAIRSNRLYANGASLAFTLYHFITTGYVPANVENNVPFRARLSIGYYRQIDDFDDANTRYVYELTLPPGASVSGTGNIEWRYGEYPSNNTPIARTYTQSGNVITITSPSNKIGYALIDLVYDCSSGSNLNLDYQFRKINNPATGCSCQAELACGSLTANVSCPGSCLVGPTTEIPIVRRADNSLGWTSSSMASKQIASNISAYDLSKALYLDEIEVHGNATQNSATTNLRARLSLPKVNSTTNKLTPIEIDVNILRAGSVISTGTLNSFTMTNSTSANQIIDWDMTALLPGGGLLAGDEIQTLSRYQVTSNAMAQHDVQSGGEWFFYNTDPITNNLIFCDSFVPEMYLVGTHSLIGTNRYYSFGCNVSSLGSNTNYLARRFDTSGFYYQSEYRPVMYVESIEADIPEGYDFVEATISGGGVLTPDNISGNTYTFNNPGSWPGVGLTVSNSYGRRYPFKVRATCETGQYETIQFRFKIKDYYYHYADTNPTSTAYEIIKTNTRTITHNDHPEVTLTNLTGTIQASNPTESWMIRMANPGLRAAPYNWIAINDVPNVQIIKIVDDATGVEVLPTPYPGGNLYLLGESGLASSNFKDYRVQFSYTSCVATEIKVLGGWNCNEYPTDPNAETCSKEELDLKFTPAGGEVEIISVTEPTTAINICTPLDYAFNINSVQAGNIVDTKFTILAPQGMQPVSGAFEVEYPVGSGNWEVVALASNTGSSYMYDLTQHSQFPSLGLPGTLNDGGNANLRLMATRFKMTSDCNFVAGSNFQVAASANNICGTSAIGSSLESQTVSTNVSGVAADYSVVTSMNILSGSFDNCSSPVVLEGTQTIITSDPIGANGIVEIELPNGYEYAINSFTCTSAICATFDSLSTNNDGNEVLKLLIPSGMDSGDFFTYTYEVSENAANFISCGNKIINVTSLDETENISCSTEPTGFCPILSVQTGQFDFDFNVDRATVAITSTNTTASFSGSNEAITTTFSIENTSLFDIAAGAKIEAFYDANQNGVYDASETILQTKTLSTGIIAGNTVTESLNFTIPSSQVCTISIGLRTEENYCFCDSVFTSMKTPTTLDGAAGADKTVCEIDASVTLGNPKAGLSYQWVGASAVETAYLDNNLAPSPTFSYNGPKITIPENLSYTVTITRPNGCTSTDTVVVQLIPSPQAQVVLTDASCGTSNGKITFNFNAYPQTYIYAFSLDNQASYKPGVSDYLGQITYDNLAAGSYHLWVKWQNGNCPIDLGTHTIGTTSEVNINNQPSTVTVKVGDNASFIANAQNADTYQWQVSTDSGSNFSNISDGTAYTGTQTTTLTVLMPNIDKNNYRYRMRARNSTTPLCSPIASTNAQLIVTVASVVTNRRITHSVNGN